MTKLCRVFIILRDVTEIGVGMMGLCCVVNVYGRMKHSTKL